ncbi:MAG: hypothetical protein R3332_11595 [Pseudohongiellaceae bacterium]|nr:hypothetical protein [Pseudohongiellaceae bacterium]
MRFFSLVLFVSLASLSACGEGPAEEMGSNIDDALTETGNRLEDACEDVREAVDASDTNC